ncbi:unnamed protein product [Mytilus coruscus]|uniref:Uncharacterized protein n=1 Tax=Mytilus coruscus TaxID=42192 RepID=A0A6J8BU14_MYTCO|nr:unnamed protein product [Mytilus coruscus]
MDEIVLPALMVIFTILAVLLFVIPTLVRHTNVKLKNVEGLRIRVLDISTREERQRDSSLGNEDNNTNIYGLKLVEEKLKAMGYKKPTPGTFSKYQTEDRMIKTERMKKTRIMQELTRIGGKLQNHEKEPVECLFILKNKATNKFKYVGFLDICDNFKNGIDTTGFED